LASPSHAKNILNRDFEDVGIGIAKGEINGRETIVVVMFLAKQAEENLAGPELISSEPELNPEEPIATDNLKENLTPEQPKIEPRPSNVFSRFLVLLTSFIFRHLPK